MTGNPAPSRRPRILVVDDDPAVHELIKRALGKVYDFVPASSGAEALRILARTEVDLVLLDIQLPGMDGLEFLRRMRDTGDSPEILALTGVHDLRTAVEVMKLGARDYVTKPFEFEALAPLIERAFQQRALAHEVLALRAEVDRTHEFEKILVGESPAIRETIDLVERVAASSTTVLITGETGTGKEVVARTIHHRSPRSGAPFVPVNCAALPADLLESELFGHERGAFTGALQAKPGTFELADGGTLFLDEIATLRPDLQAKLLRVLQDRTIVRVGGTRSRALDLRVIAATNRDLQRAVREGAFRDDLFYRLNVVHIWLPPLRHRLEDVDPLVEHFFAKYVRTAPHRILGLTAEARRALREYDWPGNVRELQNVIERAVALARDEWITLKELPMEVSLLGQETSDEGVPLRVARRRFETRFILRVLERAGWNRSEAARQLGLHRNSLALRMQQLGIREPSG